MQAIDCLKKCPMQEKTSAYQSFLHLNGHFPLHLSYHFSAFTVLVAVTIIFCPGPEVVIKSDIYSTR